MGHKNLCILRDMLVWMISWKNLASNGKIWTWISARGIGTEATPVSTKSNPFDVMSPNKVSSPTKSLFTRTNWLRVEFD